MPGPRPRKERRRRGGGGIGEGFRPRGWTGAEEEEHGRRRH